MPMDLFKKINYHYLKGICLVAGTCIGAGMIGIPVKTAGAGFYPTIVAFVVVWAVMTASALLFLEASLSFSGAVNFISMTTSIFGNTGKNIAWLICLLFMYSIMAAYASGGAALIGELSPIEINNYLGTTIFMLPFAVITYLGTKWVGFFNRLLTIGVIISFICLCGTLVLAASGTGTTANLSAVVNFNLLFKALPLMVITFGYHEIIPPLKSYLREEITTLKIAILIGSIIPLIIYITWQLLILLLIPASGVDGLSEMLSSNSNPSSSLIDYIADHYNNKNVLRCFATFSFFALTCSLTGSSWALFDFFADGLSIFRNKKGKFFLSLVTFIPPIIYAIVFPNGFLKALSLAGAFSAIIMIIYPVLMVWKIRIHQKYIAHSNIGSIENISTINNYRYQAPFGFVAMLVIFLFGVAIIVLEIINHI